MFVRAMTERNVYIALREKCSLIGCRSKAHTTLSQELPKGQNKAFLGEIEFNSILFLRR